MSDSKNRRKSRRSFVSQDGPESHSADNERMDVDKGSSEDNSWKELQSYVRSKQKEYKRGLKTLLKNQQQQSKALLLNLEGHDFGEHLEPMERDFFYEVMKCMECYEEDVSQLENHKSLIKMINIKQITNSDFKRKVKCAESALQESSMRADIINVALPVSVSMESER